MEGLGILPEVRKELIEELDIIINSAASVSFHEHLRDAIQINYNGAVRMMALAHECKKLKILSHVSTAFVGSNLPPNSLIEEAIQKETHKEDFEIQIKHILKMDHETIVKNTT
jgi:fatty acyl-CoA reductase